MINVYLNQLEERANIKLQATDSILQWLIRWVAMAYSRYKLGADGKTPYERQKGRKCVLEVVPFGELVRYKKLGRRRKSGNPWRAHCPRVCGWGAREVRARRWCVRRTER